MELAYRVSSVFFAARVVSFTSATILIGAPLNAEPIPITITGGVIAVERLAGEPGLFGNIDLSGPAGFRLRASGLASVPSCTECEPGALVRLGGSVSEFDRDFGPFGGGRLRIEGGSVVLPLAGTDVLFVRTGFTLDPLDSLVTLPPRPDPDNPDGFLPRESFQFSRRGHATLTAAFDDGGGGHRRGYSPRVDSSSRLFLSPARGCCSAAG